MSHEFLHRHEGLESFSGLSNDDHVIVDKDNWEEARRFNQLIEDISKEDVELLDSIIINNNKIECVNVWKRVRRIFNKKIGVFALNEIVRIKKSANLPKRYLGRYGRIVVKITNVASVTGDLYYLVFNTGNFETLLFKTR